MPKTWVTPGPPGSRRTPRWKSSWSCATLPVLGPVARSIAAPGRRPAAGDACRPASAPAHSSRFRAGRGRKGRAEPSEVKRHVEDLRSLAGRGVARRTLLKSSAVLAGAIAAPAIVSRSALSSSGEVNFMGWAGYDFRPSSRPSPRRPASRSTSTSSPTTAIFAQAKLSLQTGTVVLREPTVDRVQARRERRRPALGHEQAQHRQLRARPRHRPGRRDGDDRRQALLPASVWGTEALVYQHREAPMEYGKASLGDLFDPKYRGRSACAPHSALAAMGRYLDSQGKLPQPWLDSYKDMDVMKAALGHRRWPRRSRPRRTSPSSGRARTRPRRRSGPMAASLGLIWDSTGFNLQSDGCSATSPRRKAPSPGTRASC